MFKTVRKADAGFEDVYELLLGKKESLETRKAEAKQIALQTIDANFQEESEHIDRSILSVSHEVEIEVPDVVEEQVEVAETIYEQEENAQ